MDIHRTVLMAYSIIHRANENFWEKKSNKLFNTTQKLEMD